MKVNATEEELKDLIIQGYNMPEILKMTGVTSKYLLRVFTEFINQTRQPRLGYKDEPYYSSEISMEIPNYTYRSLSVEEKLIYDKLPTIETVKGES